MASHNGTNGTNLGTGLEPMEPPFTASTVVVDPAAGGPGSDATRDEGALAKVRGEASKLRGQASDRARSAAEDGKLRASETLDGFARSIHDVAGNLEEQVGPQLAQYAHRAADTLDEFSATLRNKSVDDLVDDARSFVRRSPAIAIGAALAVGFALSRFLKATATDAPRGGRNAYAIDDEDDMPSLTSDRTGSPSRYNA
ncbi:MAG: hypothetical protein Q7J32_01690 [Sphingomonadaceae bacterium]|nr:hypothetical protein [Sphingomonadaceae bacterium]